VTAQGVADETGRAVEHLSDYFRHLSTISAGAIALLATFGSKTTFSASAAWIGVASIAALGLCIVASTFMMWSYGVARRQAARVGVADGVVGAWAYDVSGLSAWLAPRVVGLGSLLAPASFVLGFALLGISAAGVLLKV
jgi:hypothetical protein